MPLLIRSRSRSDSCWYSGAGAPGVSPERRGCVVWSVSVISSTRSRWSNRCATAGSPSCLYRDARHSAAFRSLETSGEPAVAHRSEEHTSELQSRQYLVCRLLLEKKKKKNNIRTIYII